MFRPYDVVAVWFNCSKLFMTINWENSLVSSNEVMKLTVERWLGWQKLIFRYLSNMIQHNYIYETLTYKKLLSITLMKVKLSVPGQQRKHALIKSQRTNNSKVCRRRINFKSTKNFETWEASLPQIFWSQIWTNEGDNLKPMTCMRLMKLHLMHLSLVTVLRKFWKVFALKYGKS